MRIVIAGYGMAAARLAERLGGHDVTVVGEEPRPAYNRLLLAKVLTGTLTADDVALTGGGTARLGVAVSDVDPRARRVTLADGTGLPYDVLVLATGARPWTPPVENLDARVLRTLDDHLALAAEVRPGTEIAVLGGGVLGLETALALASMRARVTVVQPAGRLLERVLDDTASAVLERQCRHHGVSVLAGATAVRHEPGEGLKLDDGTFLPAAIVIAATGVRPRTELAERAGLAVDGGVIVDDGLRTSDPRVYAIGDCVRGAPGLVAHAWRQADVLAERLTGGERRDVPEPPVTRLRASGVDLTAFGRLDPDALRFSDPAGGRYGALSIVDGRVGGAVLLGLPDAAAHLADLHATGAPAPADRLALLFGRALPAGAAPAGGLVCRCAGVTRAFLVDAWRAGAPDPAAATRAGTGCGDCRDRIADLIARLEGESA
ncbi:FAD/NAD(P)-binding oxidoreductase [Actinorhabdospora filicis]|uniref:FAD/NAD(P)-binding oxidoreductase n=1 Tax=Actinorhabdospora filicis TaxID=1785913 RepID=A0A9W6SSH5_9ACTN|nr:FAD-dependent oxidoreductase [Actinorhabdospora filicis]GLZ81477.1 FAD/NAD(P)-binding oxidoreductase [Actinorhabdospora filicis]